ncbi:hypothetical protein AB4549_18880 [Vibrio breoganii]
MSDYLFSSSTQSQGKLSRYIEQIYHQSPPKITEYHGDWGSVAVSEGRYSGFLPYENKQHLLIIIGGPVLEFCENSFLTEANSNEATIAIYQRWIVENDMKWDQDLNGPFTLLLINKVTLQLQVVTDLMSFIPVYSYHFNKVKYLSTHVDALAKACVKQDKFDQTSLADFTLNGVVTYPYTLYEGVIQQPPGSVIRSENKTDFKSEAYWKPQEITQYDNLNQAAIALRNGIKNYIDNITLKMDHIGQFISAGEDSRALSGMLPQSTTRDAYVFLDSMNREGKIAKKVSDIYKANFIAGFRSKTHYLDILPEANDLIGAGHQYFHAHSLGFDKQYQLKKYSAVFGGYLSDSLLKGQYAPKLKGSSLFPFLPQIEIKNETFNAPSNLVTVIESSVIDKVKHRQQNHFNFIKSMRPNSANEWFVLYPCSMRVAIPNFYSTRRLFASYEPFMSNTAVKVSASVPTSWKLNRRLFNCAMKPYLKPSKWLLHADGRLPYYSFLTNAPIQFSIWFYRHVARRCGLIKGNQGPWGDWEAILNDKSWHAIVKNYAPYVDKIGFINEGLNIEKLLTSENMTIMQKINLLQVLSYFKKVM